MARAPLLLLALLALSWASAAAAPITSVDARHRLLAGGRPWFPLGLYTRPMTRERRLELRDAGFDLVMIGAERAPRLRPALDSLQAAGLRAFMTLGALPQLGTGDAAAKQRELAALVADAGDHPALALWLMPDEPAWNHEPLPGLIEGYRTLRRLDPRRLTWITNAPRGPIGTLARYDQATDVLGVDIYPVPAPQSQSDLPEKSLAVVGDETARALAAARGRKPVIVVLQAFAWKALENHEDRTAVWPSAIETRFMAYDAIVAGANGLLWWGSETVAPPPAFWSALTSVVSELRSIVPVLESPAASGAGAARVIGGGPARLAERDTPGGRTLIVVNRSDSPCVARIRPGGQAGARWRPLLGTPAPSGAGGDLTLALPPWGVGLLTTDSRFAPRRRPRAEPATQAPAPVAARPAPAETSDPGNLVRNPSFEAADPASRRPLVWEVRDPTTAALDNEVAHTGRASLRLRSEETGSQPLVVQFRIPLTAGHTYALSGWLRGDGSAARARLYVEWSLQGEFHSFATPWVAPGPDWARQETRFTVTPDPKGPVYVVVQVDGPGQAWFDDIRIEEVDAGR